MLQGLALPQTSLTQETQPWCTFQRLFINHDIHMDIAVPACPKFTIRIPLSSESPLSFFHMSGILFSAQPYLHLSSLDSYGKEQAILTLASQSLSRAAASSAVFTSALSDLHISIIFFRLFCYCWTDARPAQLERSAQRSRNSLTGLKFHAAIVPASMNLKVFGVLFLTLFFFATVEPDACYQIQQAE